MPELPEVETIRRGLESRLVGRVVDGIEVLRESQFKGDQDKVLGQAITALDRSGKLLLFSLANGYGLAVHLKMTGQLLWKSAKGPDAVMGGHPSAGYIAELPNKHTRVMLRFDDGSTLFFNDLRAFGYMHVLSFEERQQHSFIQALGPEPLSAAFSAEYLAARLKQKPKSNLKAFLLDQTNIAGLGNIYADESLFRAAILPTRLASDLSMGEVRNLFDSIQETLELALQHGGSTERDYRNAVGEKGTYLDVAQVYRRTGRTCQRCLSANIARIKLAGRSTHYCPQCQR